MSAILPWIHDHLSANWLNLAAGMNAEPTYFLSRMIFLRFLGLICLVAFISFWVQCTGLVGHNGILPARRFLQAVAEYTGPSGYWRLPTLFWLGCPDYAIQGACALGAGCSLMLMLGIAPLASLLMIWVLYLSLVLIGQEFMSFQWDVLLIETCFLALFITPTNWLPSLSTAKAVPWVGLLLLWWLLFRLMFESGIVKFTSGDPTWLNLSALDYHYFTQPLPTWIGWYADGCAPWFQKLSLVMLYGIEIALPCLIFLWAPCRYAACAGIIFLMLAILLTGNYTFFNLLTIGLALLLLDDQAWARILPNACLQWINHTPSSHVAVSGIRTVITLAAAGLYLFVGSLQVLNACFPHCSPIIRAERRLNVLRPVLSFNSYGLFRVMTTQRREIIVQGSADGRHWSDYEFKYKPGDVRRRPAFVAPHQPRLDWQMWFAALSTYEDTPWFRQFLIKLLEGKKETLRLLAANPFPTEPPHYVRAQLYEYRFTNARERRATGAWWKRDFLGAYSPVIGSETK